jgi:glycosyltransferase involved in cell wall biosynthesis
MTRQVLLLTYTFPPDNMAAAARPGQLYHFLPEYEYQPSVVASSFGGCANQACYVHRVPAGLESSSLQFGSRVAEWFTRFLAPYDDRWSWLPYACEAGSRLITAGPVDAIYSTSPFLVSHVAALWLRSKFHLPWIADFQDPVRDNPFRTRRWFYPYDALIERFIFANADRLLANTDTVGSAWGGRYPQYAPKISILWNSFDPREEIEHTSPSPRGYRVLAHVGALYGERHPEKLLRSLDRLKLNASDLRVKCIGPIDAEVFARCRSLFERARDRALLEFNNELISRAQALREIGKSDYLLLLDLNERNASFQLPSKLLDYVRFGKPILAYTPSDSPTERILAGSGVPHVTIDPEDSDNLADQKLAEFLRLPSQPIQPSAWFKETFNARAQAHVVANLLDGLLGSTEIVGGLESGDHAEMKSHL